MVEAIEFPSLVFPWTKLQEQGVELRIVRPGDGSPWSYTLDDLAAAVDSRTRLIATSQVSYLTGRRHDLSQLRDIADRAGALLLVDATHGAGVVPVEAALADVVVSSCYKWLLGTQGIALFYRDPQRLGGLEPPIVGWHSRASAMSLDHPDEWATPDHAGRFEAANVSYLSAYLLDSALAYLSRLPAAQLESTASGSPAGVGWIRAPGAGGHYAGAAGASRRQCDLRRARRRRLRCAGRPARGGGSVGVGR